MATQKKTKSTTGFGDFQTPSELTRQICNVLWQQKLRPASVVEPTCGTGNFLTAALRTFPGITRAVGLEINPEYAKTARSAIEPFSRTAKLEIIVEDFFTTPWPTLLAKLPEPVLVIGNPPWVTNAELGTLGSSNLPQKSNFQKFSGFDAMTGKSNFDISEWMILRFLEWLDGRRAALAVLCKTVVARKVLRHAWKHQLRLKRAEMHLIDAARLFGASVDACLLVCTLSDAPGRFECNVFDHVGDARPARAFGYRDDHLVADVNAYEQQKHLLGKGVYVWRSGIKHDCKKVMEFVKEGGRLRNGLDELVELEGKYVYPIFKSSEVANSRSTTPRRWMLVTQRNVGDDTRTIRGDAAKTWRYLESHATLLERRRSSIYRNRPRFSVFGVGDYSFAPWKVAIPAFYKRLTFVQVGSAGRKPIVLDDTTNFIACQSEQEAAFIVSLLNSDCARQFYSAFVFWDSKRPITIEMLGRLDLRALARQLGTEHEFIKYVADNPWTRGCASKYDPNQRMLFSSLG